MKRALLLLLGATGLACSSPRPADVLIVTIDTLRADHVGVYGHDRPTTPVLDALAAHGALFDTAYAPVGSTTPSHASLFTGRHPLSHGVTANGQSLPESIPTLAELARAEGWDTAAFVSSQMASSRWGLTRGFDFVDEELDQAGSHGGAAVFRSPASAVDAALAWLEARPIGGPPVFVWLHLFDPHSPYEPPPEHAALFPVQGTGPRAEGRAAYEGEVHYSDAELGRFLERFDARPGEPLVVATSDHGEGLWDHGWPVHSRTTYEEELRIPLILRWKERIPSGLRSAHPAALADLAPTIASLMDLESRDWEALDLSPWLLEGAAAEPRRELLLMRPLHPEGRSRKDEKGPGLALRSGELKVFTAPEEERLELFDVVADPHERRNLAAEREQEAKGLARSALQRAAALLRDAPGTAPEALSEEDLDRLRSLGYLR
jgi:arylsulfatase A-like enzyme